MRKQKIQDFLFHKITFSFALFVLLVLVGIVISFDLRSDASDERIRFRFHYHD